MWQIRLRRELRERLGIDLMYARPEIIDLMTQLEIDTVLDAGANVGQYGILLRAWGYRGRIISFEPLSAAYRELKAHADRDPAWETLNIGIGQADTTASINISALSVYSSILAPNAALQAFDPRSATVQTETITVRRLDSLLPEIGVTNGNIYLKADTQGYERQVIMGAGADLANFKAVELELSELPLYAGETTFHEMTSLLAAKGFRIGLIKPLAYDMKTKLLVQSDVVFVPTT